MSNAFPDRDAPLAGPFWRAAAERRLSMPWCNACDSAVWYPREACPACAGALEWKELSGRAQLHAWTVVRKPVNPLFMPQYIPALVVPDEAPEARLVTQLVDCDPASLKCDMKLKVDFRELQPRGMEPYLAPVFVPV